MKIQLNVKTVIGVLLVLLVTFAFAQSRYLAPVSNEAVFLKGLKVYSNEELRFRDTGIYIESSADGNLDIVSDVSIDLDSDSVHVDSVLTIDSFKVIVSDSLYFISGTDTFVIRTKK